MNRFLLIAAGTVALALLLFGLFRQQIRDAAYDAITADMFVEEDSDSFDPGPTIGSHFPGLNAIYRGEPVTLLEPFAGPAGTLLMASRSFDWCPYCMKQMIELDRSAQAFADAGFGLVAISYDSPGLQQAFAERHGITIPILSDVDTLSFRTLGILDPDYQPGDIAYGIPYPGMLIVAPDGRVVGKLFLEGYSTRVSAEAALAYARQQLAAADATR